MKQYTLSPYHAMSISDLFSYGWQQMRKYFLHLFLVVIVVLAADSVLGLSKDIDYSTAEYVFLQLFVGAFWLFVYPIIDYGADLIFLQAVRNKEIRMESLFIGFQKNYMNIVLAHLLTSAIIILGFLFLIIPGIIFACRLAFVPYLVMDKQLDAVAAVEKSWQMTRGHGWDIFLMAIMSFFIIILGFLCLFVGVFVAAIWIKLAFASLYCTVDMQEQEALDANGKAG